MATDRDIHAADALADRLDASYDDPDFSINNVRGEEKRLLECLAQLREPRGKFSKLHNDYSQSGTGRMSLMLALLTARAHVFYGVDIKAAQQQLRVYRTDPDDMPSLNSLMIVFEEAGANETADLLTLSSARNQMVGANLQGVRLDGLSLRRANLPDVNFINASMIGTDCSEARLSRGLFSGADMTMCNLTNVRLREGSFNSMKESDIIVLAAPAACLRGATLIGADLRNSVLSGVDMREVDASYCIFIGAKMQGVQLEPGHGKTTVMAGSFLKDVNFHESSGLRRTQVRCKAIVPSVSIIFGHPSLILGLMSAKTTVG